MISKRTKKKVLEGKYIKVNPDVLVEIKKQVGKKKFPSENNAINVTLEEKFLPKETK
jgi:hypothetical protein